MNVNEALSQLGPFGLYQFYVYFISLLPQAFSGLIFLSSVFISATPDFRCILTECESSDQSLTNYEYLSSPVLHNSCNKISVVLRGNQNISQNKCTNDLILRETQQNCQSFVYSKQQFESTIVSEWDLVCDNSWKLPFSQSALMAGILFGVMINGCLADRFGRRALFIFLPIITMLSFMSATFAPNYWIFTLATFFIAYAIVGMSQTAYIIGIELIGAKYRVFCANLTNVMFAFGSLSLCLIAYYVRDWRRLQLIISIPFCVTIFYYWLFPESVRWQVSNGQSKNALNSLRRAAKWNGVFLNEQKFVDNNDTLESGFNQKYGPGDLFIHPITRKWTLYLSFVWITNAIIYFGLSFQASNLGSNLYLTFALLSAVDIPLILIASITSQLIGRKTVLILCLFFASMSCLSTLLVSHSSLVFTVLAVFGKSSISASYAVVYIYTVELYPTFLRSTGLGICSMISRFGGIVAPFLIKLSIFGESFPLIFCGVIALISGLIVIKLPETLGKELPENFDDIQSLDKKYVIINEKTKLLNSH